MLHIVLKNDIEKSQLEALLNFLKSRNIDAEFETTNPAVLKKKSGFSLSAGIWKDYNIEASELRKQAWTRNE